MKQKTKENLIRSSNAVKHFMFQQDDLGMAELTPKGAMISFSAVIIGFCIIASLMGGGF